MAKHEVFAVNIMASPGAGKTSVVLQTIRALKGKPESVSLKGISPLALMRKPSPKKASRGANQYRRRMPSGVISNTEALNNLPLPDIDCC